MKKHHLTIVLLILSLDSFSSNIFVRNENLFFSDTAKQDNFIVIDFVKDCFVFQGKDSLNATTLSRNEICVLDSMVSEYIKNYNCDVLKKEKEKNDLKNPELRVNGLLLKDNHSYFKQYLPAQNTKNKKIVWVNCIHQTEIKEKDYKSQGIIIIADGANKYFNLWINLTDREILKRRNYVP